MPYPMTIPQYSMPPVMMAGGGSTSQDSQRHGRYGDSMLVHMNPQEVAGLQALARNQGTSLTINPQTGYPEAFNLKKLLPTLAGAALTIGSGGALSPLTIGLMTGGLGALATGSLEKGLMIGLGAAGGAGLAGSAASLAAPAAAPSAGAASVGTTAGSQAIATAPEIASTAELSNLGGAQAVGSEGLKSSITPDQLFSPTTTPVGSDTGIIDPTYTSTTQPIGVKATTAPISPTSYKYGTASSAPLTQPGGPTYTPPMSYGERVQSGFGEVFSSPEAAGKFVMDNKGTIASAALPLFDTEPKKPKEPGPELYTPYSYEVTNTSDTPISPGGIESIRYSGRFVEEEPYYAAKGGLMSYAEGGMTGTTGPSSGISVTPGEASVYRNIAAVQQAAGIPAINMSDFVINESGRLSPSVAQSLPSTIEKNYGIYQPKPEDSPTFKKIEEEKKLAEIMSKTISNMVSDSGGTFKRGGNVGKGSVRKPISRFDPPYEFGLDMTKIAEEQFARGGLSDLGPRFLSGGGDGMSDDIPAIIGGRQPARLADGEFVIPADVVSHIGNGSSKAGAKKLHQMMDRVRHSRTGKKKQAPAVKAEKHMPV